MVTGTAQLNNEWQFMQIQSEHNGVNGEHRFEQSRFAAYGEAFPIKIQGVGLAGIITVSWIDT